jgi:hypothetical protein
MRADFGDRFSSTGTMATSCTAGWLTVADGLHLPWTCTSQLKEAARRLGLPPDGRVERCVADLVEVARIKTLCDLNEGPAAVLRMQAWYRPRVETTLTRLDEVRAVHHTKADA